MSKIYVEGIRTFPKNPKAPDFVIADGVIDVTELKEFINNNQALLTDYKGRKQLKVQFLTSNKGGINIVVNDYKPDQKEATGKISNSLTDTIDTIDELPF